MSERGMGSAVGQQPAVAEKITSWVTEVATIPVIVKLTPNVTDIAVIAEAAALAEQAHPDTHEAATAAEPGQVITQAPEDGE